MEKWNITWCFDSVPKDIELYKNNLKIFYDVCNRVIKDKHCFYTQEEIEKLKKDEKKQKELNIKFIWNVIGETWKAM